MKKLKYIFRGFLAVYLIANVLCYSIPQHLPSRMLYYTGSLSPGYWSLTYATSSYSNARLYQTYKVSPFLINFMLRDDAGEILAWESKWGLLRPFAKTMYQEWQSGNYTIASNFNKEYNIIKNGMSAEEYQQKLESGELTTP